MPLTVRLAHALLAMTLCSVVALAPRSASCGVRGAIRGTVEPMTIDNLPGQPRDFESFYVSGDKPMPRGATATKFLNDGQIGAVWCQYQTPHGGPQALLQIDVYQYEPNGPRLLLLICPHCTARGHVGKDQDHGIYVREEAGKQMSFEPPHAGQSMPVFRDWTPAAMLREYPNGVGGILDVAPFGCTWDVLPQHREVVGGGVCDFYVKIERNLIIPCTRPSTTRLQR